MRNGTYTAKRRVNTTTSWQSDSARTASAGWSASGFSRNRNTVKQNTKRTLGPVTTVMIFGLLLVVLGLTYVSQGAKATQLDYDLADKTSEIEDLQAKKESLEEENARMKSIATAAKSEVAARMVDATAAGVAE